MNETYKKTYLTPFNAMTDAQAAIEKQNYGVAKELLMQAQIEAEEQIVNGDEQRCEIFLQAGARTPFALSVSDAGNIE